MKERGIAHLHLPMRGYYDLPSLLKLAAFARRFGAELLHGHSQRGSHYAGWAARLCGIAAVATAHSPKSWKYFGAVDRIIAVSAAVRGLLLRHGCRAERIDLVHNGVPDLDLEPAPAGLRVRLGVPGEAFVGAIVARLVRQKGHDLAVRLLAARPELARLHFIVAGADGTGWAQQVKAAAQIAGVAGRMHFVGERADVGAIMKAADFVFAPSRQEAFGLALVEAATVRRPVVATEVDGIPEVVLDGQTGLLVPNEDLGAMARAIERLLQDPALGERLGRAGRARYEARFTDAAMLARTLAVYGETVACRKASPRPRLALLDSRAVPVLSLLFALAEGMVP